MSGNDETTCVELTTLEESNGSQQNNGSQQINGSTSQQPMINGSQQSNGSQQINGAQQMNGSQQPMINGSQQPMINGALQINQRPFASESNNEAGAEKDSYRKWRCFRLCSWRTGSVLDGGTENPLRRYWQYLEVVLLSVAVVVVLLLMLLPTIFYHLPLPVTADGNQTNVSSVPTLDTCSEQLARTDAVNCSSGVVYTQPTCQEFLLPLQSCLPDRLSSRNVYISATDQEAVEAQASQLFSRLGDLNPSPECRAAVQPFLCLYLFGLCDSRGTAYQPTFEECVLISTDVCESEWMLANSFLALLQLPPLPECTSFPSTASAISGSGSDETTIPPSATAALAGQVNCSTLQCQEDFSCTTLSNTSLCLPVCGRWEESSRGVVLAIDVVIILSAAIGLITSIVVLVITGIRWKRMLTFPSVFVVYMTITLMVIAMLVIITYIDRTSLYCSAEHLITFEMGEARLVGSTAFCTLAGIVIYYALFQLAVWWFCHVVSLFWKIRFPFHARSFETAHRIKYIHIAMVIVGLVLPTLPVIVAFTAGTPTTRGFGMTRFPPILCTGLQRDATFYSLVLPINIALAIGVPLLIIIFWIIHKQHGLFRMKLSKHPFKIGTAERKILIVFCYYVILGVIALTAFTITTRDGTRFADAVADYWRCEITGVDPENSCDGLRTSFQQLSYPGLTSASYILLGIFPAVNLIFAVNVTEIKQKFKTWCGRAAPLYSSEERSTASTGTAISALNN